MRVHQDKRALATFTVCRDDAFDSHIYMDSEELSRYFLRISYCGTKYAGWFIQENVKTVTSVLREALARCFRDQPITNFMGCGRTDTGVHAKVFYVHFDIPVSLNLSHENKLQGKCFWLSKLNSLLRDEDVAVHDIFRVKSMASARLFATKRTYEYTLIRSKSPFYASSAYLFRKGLNVANMTLAAGSLIGKHNFQHFSKTHTTVQDHVCIVQDTCFELYGIHAGTGMRMPLTAEYYEKDYQPWPTLTAEMKSTKNDDAILLSRVPLHVFLVFRITASRFLRHMVRSLISHLLDVGTGTLSVEEFQQLLLVHEKSNQDEEKCSNVTSLKKRSSGRSVPPHGLALTDVCYDMATILAAEPSVTA